MIPVDRHPQDTTEMRAALALRTPCDDMCLGWFVCGETLRVTACDACRVDWSTEPPAELYDDVDVALLPEARAARVQVACQTITRGRPNYAVTRRGAQRPGMLRRVMTTLLRDAYHEARHARAAANRPSGR